MPLSHSGVHLCWAFSCLKCRKAEALGRDAGRVEQWLAARSGDPLVPVSLRQFAAQYGADPAGQLDERGVARLVAAEVASGFIRLCDRNWETPEPHFGSAQAVEGPSNAFKAFPITDRSKKQAGDAQAPEASTLPENLNVLAQAAVLRAAAAQGAPFCPE